jgi:hypothetical protein
MRASIIKLMRMASFVICAIVIVSFGIFAAEQTQGASKHQQEEIANGNATASQSTSAHTKQSSLHKAIDEASAQLTSPFSGLLSGAESEWVIRGANLLLALAVYGFGLSFLARFLLVRT